MAARRTATVANKPEDTRMQRDRLQEEHAKEQQDRSAELSMISFNAEADDRDGVWDAQDGSLIEPGLTDETEDQVRRLLQIPDADDDTIIEEEDALVSTMPSLQTRSDGPRVGPNGTPIDPDFLEQTRDDVEDAVADFTPARPHLRVQKVERSEKHLVIRVNADLDPTIGQGPKSQWHFKRGKRYRVPEHVAFHLHEKGYVSAWG